MEALATKSIVRRSVNVRNTGLTRKLPSHRVCIYFTCLASRCSESATNGKQYNLDLSKDQLLEVYRILFYRLRSECMKCYILVRLKLHIEVCFTNNIYNNYTVFPMIVGVQTSQSLVSSLGVSGIVDWIEF
mgnify:CR=1 FL=1